MALLIILSILSLRKCELTPSLPSPGFFLVGLSVMYLANWLKLLLIVVRRKKLIMVASPGCVHQRCLTRQRVACSNP